MFVPIDNNEEIKSNYDKMIKILNNGTKSEQREIRNSGSMVNWNEQLKYWYFEETVTEKYVVHFGTDLKNNDVTLEINLQKQKPNSHSGSYFVKNTQGEVYLVRSSSFGGKGKKTLYQYLSPARWIENLVAANGESIHNVIGKIDDKAFIEHFVTFLHEVSRIKQSIEQKGSNQGRNREFVPECEKYSYYYIDKNIKQDCRHSKLVNKIESELVGLDYKITNYPYDLAILNKKKDIVCIMEVKIDPNSTDLHTAVGQLYVYSIGHDEAIKIFITNSLKDENRDLLNQIDINSVVIDEQNVNVGELIKLIPKI